MNRQMQKAAREIDYAVAQRFTAELVESAQLDRATVRALGKVLERWKQRRETESSE